MRNLLLKTVLLAMFLNMAFGMARHEAGHWQAAIEAQQLPGEHSPAHPGDGDGDDAHAPCAACHAHAQLAMALGGTAAPRVQPCAAAGLAPAAPAQAELPSPGRWRFASRDPPLA